MSPPVGYKPLTVQPVASRYTVYATPAYKEIMINLKYSQIIWPRNGEEMTTAVEAMDGMIFPFCVHVVKVLDAARQFRSVARWH
jgi:hypothetical protein